MQCEDLCLDRPVGAIWEQALTILSKRLKHATFQSWILPTTLVKLTMYEAELAVANDVARTWVAQNSSEIEAVLRAILGRAIKLRLIVDQTAVKGKDYMPSIASISVAPSPRNRSIHTDQRSAKNCLIPNYVFDSFVVGSSNRFAHAAALSVSESLGQSYNPLIVYGGVGLGKTHLLHAIGNAVLQNAPNTLVRFITSEKFTNEVIHAIHRKTTPELRKRYREIDLLLMDDIQFLEGKEATQEEFFNTFNHLRDNGKQIVLTCDRQPREMSKIAARLRSRFEQGLVADIQSPDYEMRFAILQKKAAEKSLTDLPEFVLDFIASSFTNNMRELEGALLKIQAFCSLNSETPLTPDLISKFLCPSDKKKERPTLTAREVIDAVASYYRVEASDIRSAKRSQQLTQPRHLSMYLIHKILKLSSTSIGEEFGNRKHTSVLYALEKVERMLGEDKEYAQTVKDLCLQLDFRLPHSGMCQAH